MLLFEIRLQFLKLLEPPSIREPTISGFARQILAVCVELNVYFCNDTSPSMLLVSGFDIVPILNVCRLEKFVLRCFSITVESTNILQCWFEISWYFEVSPLQVLSLFAVFLNNGVFSKTTTNNNFLLMHVPLFGKLCMNM